jgi:hypothetical protein
LNSAVNKDNYDLPYEFHKFDKDYFRIERVNCDIASKVMSFIEGNMQSSFIHLLKEEEVSQSAFNILDCLNAANGFSGPKSHNIS